jgi:hypothetical protein
MGALDPYYEAVTVLLTGDSSTVSHDWYETVLTSVGNVHLADGDIVFGGSGSYIEGPLSCFSPANKEFCIEVTFTLAALPTSDSWPTDWSNHMVLVEGSVPRSPAGLNFVIGTTKIMSFLDDVLLISANHGITVGVEQNFALTFDGSMLRIFKNGTIISSVARTATISSSGQLYIATETTEGAWLNGKIKSLRVTVGASRYTANYTPASSEFPWLPKRQYSYSSLGAITNGESGMVRGDSPVPEATDSIGGRAYVLLMPDDKMVKNGFTGRGMISGNVKYAFTTPMRRRVRLIEESTGEYVAETWGDEDTGDYEFLYISERYVYTVICYDYTGFFKAVSESGVVPRTMPSDRL